MHPPEARPHRGAHRACDERNGRKISDRGAVGEGVPRAQLPLADKWLASIPPVLDATRTACLIGRRPCTGGMRTGLRRPMRPRTTVRGEGAEGRRRARRGRGAVGRRGARRGRVPHSCLERARGDGSAHGRSGPVCRRGPADAAPSGLGSPTAPTAPPWRIRPAAGPVPSPPTPADVRRVRHGRRVAPSREPVMSLASASVRPGYAHPAERAGHRTPPARPASVPGTRGGPETVP